MTSARIFAFCARLAAGRELGYERFHRAVPADLDRAMREAGVLGWRIYRNGSNLTHVVETRDRTRMRRILDTDPVNLAWQQQVAPFLDPAANSGDDHATPVPPESARGALIWDLSWPTR